MSFALKPCVGGATNFHYLPNVNVFYGQTTYAAKTWHVALVGDTGCGRTEMFTQNAEQIAGQVVGAKVIPAGPY
jgi:hypothetical protein